ncbi:hypothetical protein [Caenibacillus caldisaponilyticus]|uniref:hypothetical protein n=1 Tax=Caenibacillus caldisaponilyticus TaxID=1674942 RepID=UPI001177E86C|nr:hypothetical protein [Caenibacillus caldisaponilyticus]
MQRFEIRIMGEQMRMPPYPAFEGACQNRQRLIAFALDGQDASLPIHRMMAFLGEFRKTAVIDAFRFPHFAKNSKIALKILIRVALETAR